MLFMEKMNLPVNFDRLQEIEEEIATCIRCKLYRTRNMTVPGHYPDTAKGIVFISDGPHPIEDVSGKPLIGRAGTEFTDAVYETMGLQRSEYNILYCVKCIPIHRKERTEPYASEIFWCAKYLYSQLEILNPKLIITLGKTAFYTLLLRNGTEFKSVYKGIGDYVGHLYYAESLLTPAIKWLTVPTYDPTGWLFSHAKHNTALENLKKAKVIFDAIDSGKSIEDFLRCSPSLQPMLK